MDTNELPQICENCPENATCNCDPEMWKCELDAKEIRQVLAGATPAPWKADIKKHPGNEHLQYWVMDMMDGIGAFVSYRDAYLAANAPTWLHQLLEKVELLEHSNADLEHNRKLLSDEKHQLLDENTKLKEHLENEQQDLEDMHEMYVQEGAAHRDEVRRLQDENDRLKKELAKVTDDKKLYQELFIKKQFEE